MPNLPFSLTLENGVVMPGVGFGVYQTKPEETVASVIDAIDAGYRLIDTAAIYGNEREVGAAIAQSGVDRTELFITTKLWIHDYGHDATRRAFDASLAKLGLERIDLYLLHWPVPVDFDATIASYEIAEELLADGRVASIGVSNFELDHLDRLMTKARVVPAVNQIELHPYFPQVELRAKHAEMGIITQAWSPLGGVNVYDAQDPAQQRHLLDDPVLGAIAADHGRTTAQVVLRWHVQHGISVIPKSVRRERIVENISVFDFALSPTEMALIDALDTGVRGGPDPQTGDRQRFPATVAN